MEYKLKKLYARDYHSIKHFFDLRDPGICDSMFIDNYIWQSYYDTSYFTSDKGLFFVFKLRNEYFSILPMCKEEDLEESFNVLKEYFNSVLSVKLKIYIADEVGVNTLKLGSDFIVKENRNYFDYVYNAESLRTLSGKKLHNKRNHYNAFVKNYTGRYRYEKVCCQSLDEIKYFLTQWYANKKSDDSYNRLAYEHKGLIYLLDHCRELDYKMGVVYIDEKIQAFTLGSYSKSNNMAFIHIEKANTDFRGLYSFINKEFLLHEYPDVELVNREDDMGLEGLRAAKLSYKPLYLAKKYSIIQV